MDQILEAISDDWPVASRPPRDEGWEIWEDVEWQIVPSQIFIDAGVDAGDVHRVTRIWIRRATGQFSLNTRPKDRPCGYRWAVDPSLCGTIPVKGAKYVPEIMASLDRAAWEVKRCVVNRRV